MRTFLVPPLDAQVDLRDGAGGAVPLNQHSLDHNHHAALAFALHPLLLLLCRSFCLLGCHALFHRLLLLVLATFALSICVPKYTVHC